MIYEVINPSDTYTLITDDFICASIAIAFLGNGQWGIKSEDGKQQSPVLFGWDAWLKENKIDLDKYLTDNKLRIAEILETILIGDISDRKEVEATLILLPKDKIEGWLKKRHDRKRSSLNDIGRAAKKLAGALREVQKGQTIRSHATPVVFME